MIALIFGSMPRYVLLKKIPFFPNFYQTVTHSLRSAVFKPFLKQGTVTLKSVQDFRNSSSCVFACSLCFDMKDRTLTSSALAGRGSGVHESTEFHRTGSEVNVTI